MTRPAAAIGRPTHRARLSRLALFLLPLLLVMTGCGRRTDQNVYQPTDVGVLVVDGILHVNQPYPSIYLRQTLAPDATYSEAAAAVHDATLTVTPLNAAGAPLAVMHYRESRDRDGRYVPFQLDPGSAGGPAPRNRIDAQQRYRLDVNDAAGGRSVTAETTTPALFHLAESVLLDDRTLEVQRTLRTYAELGQGVYSAPENRLTYQEGLLESRFALNGSPAYQVGLSSLDIGSPRLLNADFLSEADYAKLTRENSSPALEAPHGYVRLPWFAIFWAGRYRVTVHAIDANWYDFIRSVPQLNGGFGFGGNAGDNFERPLFHITGGIGLFGSACSDSVGFYVAPPDTAAQ